MITILSVTCNSYEYLLANKRNFKRQNPNLDYEWLLIDNSDSIQEISGFKVVGSIDNSWQNSNEFRGIYGGSIPHGLGLDLGLKHINSKSDYLLCLDPDFYVNRPIQEIIDMMEEEKLTFYGAAYVNMNKKLYRHFPAAYCMFIKLSDIDYNELEFRAGFRNEEEELLYSGHPDVGYRVFMKYNKYPSRCCYNRHNTAIGTKCDWFDEIQGFHLRMKVEKRNYMETHRVFLKKLLHGNFDKMV